MDKVKLLKAVEGLTGLTMSEWTTLKYIVDNRFDSKQKEYMRSQMLPAEDVKRDIDAHML